MNKEEEQIVEEVSKVEITPEEKTIYDLTENLQIYMDVFLKKFIEEYDGEITRDVADTAVALFLKNYTKENPSLVTTYDIEAAAIRSDEGLRYEIQIEAIKEKNGD